MALRIAGAGGVLVLSGRDGEKLDELAGELPGDGHVACVVDLGSPGGAEQLIREAGSVDCLVANAALPATGQLDELDSAQVARMLRVNLEAPIHLTQAVLPGMIERGEGKVVLVGSLSGKAGSPRSSVYNATKFGLRGFAFGLRTDLVGTGVGVTVVAPGFVRDAGMFADTGVKAPRVMGTTTPGKVADAVSRAIREDRAEITVAPALQRLLAHIGLLSPRLAHRAQSSEAGRRTAEELASRQTDKR
jgi:short-subunit dehydrogenase